MQAAEPYRIIEEPLIMTISRAHRTDALLRGYWIDGHDRRLTADDVAETWFHRFGLIQSTDRRWPGASWLGLDRPPSPSWPISHRLIG
jgi:hypothetical protein